MFDHDDPDRQAHYIQVARVKQPPAGRPGSFGSGRFGVLYKEVPTGSLNFTRGIRMELELIGPKDTSIFINNWDPYVYCTAICKDITRDDIVDAIDFLTIVGEYGHSSAPSSDPVLTCLDGDFSEGKRRAIGKEHRVVTES